MKYEYKKLSFTKAAHLFWVTTAFSVSLSVNVEAVEAVKALTMQQAVQRAQQQDPWLTGNRHKQSVLEAESVVAGTLPDPTVSLSLANLPVDGFDFGQEAMTQFKVGYSQMFPQGDSLAIRQKQLQQLSEQFPHQREDRKAKIALTVGHLWLDTLKAQQSIALIEKKRSLFEQLTDVAQASYASTLGKTRQQDIVRAQLELTRLEDRLTQLKQAEEVNLERLTEWLSNSRKMSANIFSLVGDIPQVKIINEKLTDKNNQRGIQMLGLSLSKHPAVLAVKNKIIASQTGVELANQKYKPAWGLNASYGYRDDDPAGQSRSDFFSVGVSFEIPLNTSKRQDKRVAAAIEKSSAIKTEKWQLMRRMMAQFEETKARLYRLQERETLYKSRLLPQIHQQAEASLTAYTNDDGDFAEVVRARIAELNAEIDALAIKVDKQKTIVSLNYFLVTENISVMLKTKSVKNLANTIESTGEKL